MKHPPLTGLIAATHTPFREDGEIHLDVVEKQAMHLAAAGVNTVFVNGTTGESHSLALTERLALAERWCAVARGTSLRIVVHVGSNCLVDARTLAEQARRLGAAAISALSPSYFKPKSLDELIASIAFVAAAAPETPFYFYDIPSMTQTHFSMPDFLATAPARVPTLAGIKFTNSDLMAYQLCLRADGGRFDLPWGCDEFLLAALAFGARGAVGSSYNFAAPLYRRVWEAFERGDLVAAREEQFRSVRLIRLLGNYGYMGAAKAVMNMLGVPVGPPRLPHGRLDERQGAALRGELESLGFFDRIAR